MHIYDMKLHYITARKISEATYCVGDGINQNCDAIHSVVL
jgi:hypothetical protein